MTRQSTMNAWRVSGRPSKRDSSGFVVGSNSRVDRRSLPGAAAGANDMNGERGEIRPGRTPALGTNWTGPSRPRIWGRFRHQVSRSGFLLLCILYLITLCSCHRLHEPLSLSNTEQVDLERRFARGSGVPAQLRSEDTNPGNRFSPTSCQLSSPFHRVITTDCVPCPLSKPTLCPAGTVPLTQGSGDRGCIVPSVSGITAEIIGCSQRCQWTEIRHECCAGFWGPMCIECPGGSSNPCNGRGRCQGTEEAEQCLCNPAFKGVSCELCARDDVYGPNCDQACDCVYGVCNAGAMGDGFCLCEAGYQGPRCNQAKISCGEPACHPFAICSPPVTDGGAPQCVCSPGYSGDGRVSCVENDPCQNPRVCSPNAQCNHTGPGRYTCECLFGYYGDGVECYPINRCQQQFPLCPPPSSKCVFDGPMRYHCECEEGFENYVFPLGCKRINICTGADAPQCPPHSLCTMASDGSAGCQCLEGFQGDGQACYGSIMQVLRDLNSDPRGTLQGSLATAISVFDFSMGYFLSGRGLFTVFAPTEQAFQEADYELNDRAFRDVDFARYLMKLHTIPTLMDAHTLNSTGTVYTLAGIMAEVTHKDGNADLLRYRLECSNTRARLIHKDIPAANGVIHVIDRVLYEPAPVENNLQGTVSTVLSTARRFNRMQSLLMSAGLSNVIPPGVSYTILAPMNKAFNQLPDGSLDYLMSAEGRPKLLALLKNHVIRDRMLLMQDLITTGHVTSLYGSMTSFHIYPNGLIGMDGGANITFSDIIASDGYVHSIDGLIIPLDIDPLISHRCDVPSHVVEQGPCSPCNETTLPSSCPAGSTPTNDAPQQCLASVQGGTLIYQGCQLLCNKTVWEPECCAGFYSQACLPCPGGFAIPCSGHGQCADSMQGSGVCSCDENFTGTACELCTPNLFGTECNQVCTCVHGECDGGPQGTGHCRGGCEISFTGEDCNVRVEGCGPQVHACHENAFCDSSGSEIRCICQAGYSGSGLHCEPLDPCRLPERGGCHREAFCTYTGPGLSECTCNTGWEGDGFECDAINPCIREDHGGCADSAICAYISPGVNNCHCYLGFSGNGYFCDPINPCLLMTNGGCHAQADCIHTGPGTSDCQCRDGYGGNGWLCYQSLPLEIATIPRLGRFYDLIQLADMERYLASAPGLTVFTPNNEAIERFEASFGAVTRFLATLLVKMHIVNGTYSERDLYRLAFDDDQYLPSLLPSNQILVHDCDHHLCVNDVPVQLSDIPATNGWIHILGDVLIAEGDSDLAGGAMHFGPHQPFRPSVAITFGQLIDQTESNSTFLALLQQHGLADTIHAASMYTVFFPTNDAVSSFNASRITSDVLRYHIVLGQALAVSDIDDGMHVDSFLGHNYQLRFRKESDNLFVNNIPVTRPNLIGAEGIVHVVPEVLFPLPNRCDANHTTLTQSTCGNCRAMPDCPFGTVPVAVNPGLSSCQYNLFVPGVGVITQRGCRGLCRGITFIPECCSGFYRQECAECPGGWSSPCSNHGTCSDGTNGTGTCSCLPNFTGTACEMCEPGRYGARCDQVCNCVHGHCRDGPDGDGRCICDLGYTGIRCDRFSTATARCTVVCDVNAYCLEQQCICYQGYIGNGTHCVAHDPCSEEGVCSEQASCRTSADGVAECSCLEGYSGDGVFCERVNPCLDDDDGCHELAECIHTGPGMSTCHCQAGYEGNGRTQCNSVNACLDNNGGCSPRAHCTPTGPALRNCTCFAGHIGNGLECTGNIAEELALNTNVSKFVSLLEEFEDLMRVLGSVGPLTILVPTNEAFEYISQQQIDEWRLGNQLSRVLMNHMVGCTAFLAPSVNGTTSLSTLAAQPIHVTYSFLGGLTVNREAHITSADFITSNGIVHSIDRVLVPPSLDPRPDYLENLPLEMVAPNATYSIFLNLMERSGVMATYSTPMYLPATVFIPTNQAFQELYPGKLAELRDPANVEMLKEYLKYHIIPHRTIRSTQIAQRGLQGLTQQGSNITIQCKKNKGFFINQDSMIIDTETKYRDGVFYALDMVLEPPSIGGRCDIIENITFSTDCYPCHRTIMCPAGSMPSGGNRQDCYIPVGWYNYQRGCLRHCVRQEVIPNCCSQHYGPDCQVCPGGKRNPCSWHGACDDGNTGNGKCSCEEGFTGVACELCEMERFGPNCEECQCTANGQCSDGMSGTGSCFCEPDYVGTHCETRLSVTPTCNPPCHVNAVCRLGNQCQCRPEYYGNGYLCTVSNQCSYSNGGCSMYADCSQVDTEVRCHCRDNYEGDGFICQPIDPCMTNNGGCHGNATCKLTGPNSRSCTCNLPFQGDGIICSKLTPSSIPACSIDNGGCHENAFCIDSTNSPVGPPPGSDGTSSPGRGFGVPAGTPQHPPPTLPDGRTHLDEGGLVPPGTGEVRCECKPGYVGTGQLCNGNAFETLASMRSLSVYYNALLRYAKQYQEGEKLVGVLKNEMSKLTLFIPVDSAKLVNAELSTTLIGNHVVVGRAYRKSELAQGLSLTAWSERRLLVEWSDDKTLILVNSVPVRVFDIPVTNGLLHIVSDLIDADPVNVSHREKSPDGVSVSKLFAGILITVFVVILVVVVGFVIFVKVRRKRRSRSRQVISRYSVNGGNDDGSVTFSRGTMLTEEDEEEDSETAFHDQTIRSPVYNATDMDSDTVGFAELDFTRAY